MPNQPLIISTGTLNRSSLAGQVAVVTGAGRGIGQEAARSLFEKQWTLRDFRKNAGLPVEEWLSDLRSLQSALESGTPASLRMPLAKLSGYYRHMAELAKGYERNPQKLQEALAYLDQAAAALDALAGVTGV